MLDHDTQFVKRRIDTYRAELVVSTIPWPVFHHKVDDPPDVADALGRLRASTLVVSLYEESFAGDMHWRYIPDPGLAHHREFYIPNFCKR